MADKPLYYGAGKNSSPMYYGSGKSPLYYGGASKHYGKPAYGGAYGGTYGGAYGGAYGGSAYGGASNSGAGEDGSLVGKISLGRMYRVVSQRWLSVFVFLLIGLIVAFVVYRISPTVYQATSEFTMDMRRSSGGTGKSAIAELTPDYGSSYSEILNTRMPDWQSGKIFTKIVQQYRANHPASTVSDEDIISTVSGAQLELQRGSRIITITIRSKIPTLCAALANAYAQSIEEFTDEENKIRCDRAVSQIHSNVEKQRRVVDKVAKTLLDFRTANKVDNLRSTRETLQQSFSKTTSDILALESAETQLIEWEKMLAQVQKDPTSYGSLSVNVPRAQEIATEFAAFQTADNEYQTLLFTYTENHPDVISKKKAMELSKKRFIDAAVRALQTGRSTLQVTRNQLANLKVKQDMLRTELASTEQRIVLAESGLGQLDADFGVQNKLLEELLLDENKARLEAESNNEIVRVGRQAGVPTVPILPKPMVIFGAGAALSLVLGLLFVLILDNLEDTVINLADIEGRLALKVLAVLPHVRRKKREQVAKYLIEDKYSQFAESVASLRNLLESPRYEALSHCVLVISTQPGEGKTITSASLAIAYAQTGKHTLHVDFDLRRPRLAKVWGLELTKERSFSHTLQAAGNNAIDFAALVNATEVPGLDVIASLSPDGVSPATIFGSSVVNEFFDWARSNYDRVIVDSPPFGLVGDVVSLAVLTDSVLIMCCPDRTHFKPIQYCSRNLTEAGANILGVVVNDVEVAHAAAFTPGAHRHHHKYGYGYGYGSSYGYGYGYGYGSYKPKKEDPKKQIEEKSNQEKQPTGGESKEFGDEE